ncbi:MAG: NADH-dependent [FeFe] hydrogenase, group A6 [bacterium]
MYNNNKIEIDGREVLLEGEKNILEVIRKAKIDLPTFCYHSELSVFGACRLCLVDIEGRGIVSSCSVPPEPNMKLKTNTAELREIRKISIELLLANHDQNCQICPKNTTCKLQEIAFRLGVTEVRFKKTDQKQEIDFSSCALVRDPNKCILCGDCVRACTELQGIGAIDFAFRGSGSKVVPAFGKNLAAVECVDCGQCARVCPTGALTPKNDTAKVWKALDNPKKVVIAQVAPAVRVAIGELFGLKPGELLTGQVVSALKRMGFDKVFDTAFAADLTVIEEANEFIARKTKGENLPLFTSCCPGWVKFAEQYFPDMLQNLSSCKSPQQMFGSIAKETLSKQLNIDKKDIVIVSIMPCTAKKFEADREEFKHDGIKEVDIVITTQELGGMIKQAGLKFTELEPESLDLPLGFKTGAGIIFGNSGGVTEAVLRYAVEKVNNVRLTNADFLEVRGTSGIREYSVQLAGETINVAVVFGLKNAKTVMNNIKNGTAKYDLVEVMACPNGCIGGAGQPVYYTDDVNKARAKGLYDCDKMLQLHKAQDNPYVAELYNTTLGEPNSHKAHELLHTEFRNRKRISDEKIHLISAKSEEKLSVNFCVGTSCYLKGAQNLLHRVIDHVEKTDLKEVVQINATFCMENCDEGPSVTIGEKVIKHANFKTVCDCIENELKEINI